MSRAAFPAFMPAPMVSGFSQTPDFGMLVTEMDSGPDKQRPRNSVAKIPRAVQYTVHGLDKRNDFERWVRADLAGGSLWFDWPDQLSGTTKIARIVGGKVEYSPVDSINIWLVKFTLETYG